MSEQLTVYPDGVTTIDGQVERSGVDETWSAIRNGAGNAVNTGSVAILAAGVGCSTTTDQFASLFRGIFTFDTSALAGGTVTAVTLSLVGHTKAFFLSGSPSLHVAGATPASNNNLVAADYSQVQRVSFGSIAYADFNTDGTTYNDIVLNASGLAQINTAGITRFSTQLDSDINDAPTWASGGLIVMYCKSADNDISIKPKLVITYTPRLSPSFRINKMRPGMFKPGLAR